MEGTAFTCSVSSCVLAPVERKIQGKTPSSLFYRLASNWGFTETRQQASMIGVPGFLVQLAREEEKMVRSRRSMRKKRGEEGDENGWQTVSLASCLNL